MFFGMYNIGNQTLDYLTLVGSANTNDWHHALINLSGLTQTIVFNKNVDWCPYILFQSNAVTFAVGILWEILFAVVRKHRN